MDYSLKATVNFVSFRKFNVLKPEVHLNKNLQKFGQNVIPSKLSTAVTLLACIQEMFGLNLGGDTESYN
jgi:hypothetical protein